MTGSDSHENSSFVRMKLVSDTNHCVSLTLTPFFSCQAKDKDRWWWWLFCREEKRSFRCSLSFPWWSPGSEMIRADVHPEGERPVRVSRTVSLLLVFQEREREREREERENLVNLVCNTKSKVCWKQKHRVRWKGRSRGWCILWWKFLLPSLSLRLNTTSSLVWISRDEPSLFEAVAHLLGTRLVFDEKFCRRLLRIAFFFSHSFSWCSLPFLS